MFVKQNVKAQRRNRYALMMLGGCLMLFTGCEKESLTVDQQSGMQEQSSNSTLNYKALYAPHHTMGWEEAVALAEEAAVLYFGKGAEETVLRRSGNRRIVNGGRVLGRSSATLRSFSEDAALPDTMAYICNFADSAGFAVICADDRVGCPVLACVESGSLGDSVDNPGLAIFLENAQAYMEESILRFEEDKDSLMEVAERELAAQNSEQLVSLRSTYTGSYKLLKGTEEVTPLIYTIWGQSGSPYDRLMKACKSTKSGRAPAGCWAAAVAQLMAYYYYPERISGNGMTLVVDWDALTNFRDAKCLVGGDVDQLAKLYAIIGKNVGMDYDCDGSGAKGKKVMSYLKSIGFTSCATSDYSFEKVKRQLDLKRPVLMSGDQKKVLFIKYEGHSWIVDGYSASKVEYYNYKLNTETGYCFNTLQQTTYTNPLLHVNWGWEGVSNGYFAAGCFDVQKAVQYDIKKGDDKYNYKYDLEIHTAWR